MKLTNEEGVLVLYFTPTCYLHTINHWYSFRDYKFTKFFEFSFIDVHFDRDDMIDRYDFGFVILGLGLSLKINVFEQDKK